MQKGFWYRHAWRPEMSISCFLGASWMEGECSAESTRSCRAGTQPKEQSYESKITVSIGIVPANNHYAGFDPATSNGFRKMLPAWSCLGWNEAVNIRLDYLNPQCSINLAASSSDLKSILDLAERLARSLLLQLSSQTYHLRGCEQSPPHLVTIEANGRAS